MSSSCNHSESAVDSVNTSMEWSRRSSRQKPCKARRAPPDGWLWNTAILMSWASCPRRLVLGIEIGLPGADRDPGQQPERHRDRGDLPDAERVAHDEGADARPDDGEAEPAQRKVADAQEGTQGIDRDRDRERDEEQPGDDPNSVAICRYQFSVVIACAPSTR